MMTYNSFQSSNIRESRESTSLKLNISSNDVGGEKNRVCADNSYLGNDNMEEDHYLTTLGNVEDFSMMDLKVVYSDNKKEEPSIPISINDGELGGGGSSHITNQILSPDSIPTIPLSSFCPLTKKKIRVHIPQIGFGTYKFKKGVGEATRCTLDALHCGYRHIDTAFIYGGEKTEEEVGIALTSISNKIPRSDIFLTTKQWRSYHGYESTKECLRKSLTKLQTDYIDLYLIHWPGCSSNQSNNVDNVKAMRAKTWHAMEDAIYEGKVRAIGVSNFTVKHLTSLKETARIWPPAVNQIELHPYNPQKDLVQFCKGEGIVIQAYASLGGQDSGKKTWNVLGGKLLDRPEVSQIATKYKMTTAQVLLRWATQQGLIVIPKSRCIQHMKLNLEAIMDRNWNRNGSIGLDDDDLKVMEYLDKSRSGEDLRQKARLCWVRDPLKMLDFD